MTKKNSIIESVCREYIDFDEAEYLSDILAEWERRNYDKSYKFRYETLQRNKWRLEIDQNGTGKE